MPTSPKGLRQHNISVRDSFLQLRARNSDHSVDYSFSLLFDFAILNELNHHCCFSVLNIKQDVYQATQALTESRFNIVDI
jgi:hypothetical protein